MKAPFVRALVAGLLVVVAAAGSVAANGPGTSQRDMLLRELGRGRTVVDDETGRVSFVAGTRGRPAANSALLGGRSGAQAAARAFMARYASLFGVRDAANDLRMARSQAAAGSTFVRFQQVLDGVPVIAGELIVQVDAAGNVISATGEATDRTLATRTPKISATQAAQIAQALVAREAGSPGSLSASRPQLAVFDPQLVGAPGLPGARLVWRTEVRSADRSVDEYVLVDSASGTIALRFSQVEEALPAGSRVCNAAGATKRYPCVSGDLGGQAHAEVVSAKAYMLDFYEYFLNRFGRDSVDGAGMPLVATVNLCDFSGCPTFFANAFWDGKQAVFWRGMAVDDVVTHEFMHAFTEFTSGLLYYHQSGAINEALSDIFGELVDIENLNGDESAANRWLMGEGSVLGAIRDMESPTSMGQPDRMQSPTYYPYQDDNYGVHSNSGVANKAASLMVDGGTFNGQTVAGIGADKAAAIWYHVATQYLWGGSDYADLGAGLNQSCTNLKDAAATIRDGSGADTADPVVEADCAEVAKAVLATEMALDPSVAGANAPPAPDCVGGSYAEQFIDTFDSGPGSWTLGGSRFGTSDVYSETPGLALHGSTPEAAGMGVATRDLGSLTVDMPTFVALRHAYFLEYGYDGGVVEYSANGGPWTDAGGLFTHNGYTETLQAGWGNPLANRRAFTGSTPGYMTSRLDLSNLSGQDVQLRLVVGSDSIGAREGWFIESIKLFTCAGATDIGAPLLSAPNASFRSGVAVGGTNPIKLNVSFSASDYSGLSATGLQQRTNAGSWSSVALGSSTGTSVDLDYVTSKKKKRQLRSSATDAHGNAAGWLASAAFKVLAVQNGARSIVQLGSGWKTHSNSSFYGGSVRHNPNANARQRLTRSMSDVAVVTTLGPNRGKFDVYIDGQYKATIDTYAATTQYKQVVFAWDFGSAARHTVELRVLGAKNAASSGTRVDLDAFLVLAP